MIYILLCKNQVNLKINVIPNGLEKFRSFSINNKLRFIDIVQFLRSSLDSLVKNLAKDDFKYLSQEFDSNVLDLVRQKGFYPYEYIGDPEKFKEQLPSKENFYSSLIGKKISDREYYHVPKVGTIFEIKTMKDYHDLYLKCDVLLSDDAFEKFRNNSIKNYGLCPNHYLSSSAFSCHAMLNMAKVKFELISDPDMYMFFEKGMRCGVSYISNRYSKANSKYLKSYDQKQESKYIIYLEANNLYGYAMPTFLPTGGFK